MLKKTVVAVLLLCSLGFVSADKILNLTILGTYTDQAPPGSIESPQFITYGKGFDNRLIVTSSQDDSLTIINVTSKTSPVEISSATDSAAPNSLDNAKQMATCKNITFVASYNTDQTSAYNITGTVTALGSTAADSLSDFSQDGAWGIACKVVGNEVYVAVTSQIDDYVSWFNFTTPTSPTSMITRSATANPCSLDSNKMLIYDPDRQLLIGGSETDDTISVFNTTGVGYAVNFTCISQYTDSTPPNSVDGVTSFFYDNNTMLLYASSPLQHEITILNLTNPSSITAVGSLRNTASNLTNASTYYIEGLYAKNNYLFGVNINSTVAGVGQINVWNVANPSSITLAQRYNTSTSCGYSNLYDITGDGDYIFVAGGLTTQSCVYVLNAFSDYTPGADSCTYTSGDWNVALADNCVVTSTVNVYPNSLKMTGAGTFTIGSGGNVITKRAEFTPSSFTGSNILRLLVGGNLTVKP